jgi:hypothetical protein
VPWLRQLVFGFPTSAASILSKARYCGMCGGQSGTGADCLQVIWFPLPILFPPVAQYPLILSLTLYILNTDSAIT